MSTTEDKCCVCKCVNTASAPAELEPESSKPDWIDTIVKNDNSMFDNVYILMKEKFAKEMRRIEEEMTRFSTDLARLTGETKSSQQMQQSQGSKAKLVNVDRGSSSEKDKDNAIWEMITKSSLVEGEGDNRVLKLLFDVSQFKPDEVKIKILNDDLIISAKHQEKTEYSSVLNEYNRKFQLPKFADPEAIDPSIDNDGVLTVKVPLTKDKNKSPKSDTDGNKCRLVETVSTTTTREVCCRMSRSQ